MELSVNLGLENPAPKRYFGKYRGTVINNIDPMQQGRIMAIVPDVSSVSPSSWAMPCVPVGGIQMGIYAVPPIGAGVWIEFEHGDPDRPIWTGCFWGSAGEVPALALAGNPASPSIVLQTTMQNTLVISDMPGPAGGFILKTTTGAMLMINDVGITISNGKGAVITMTGPTVDINAGALTVV
jgi:uncharacterized protein involved in type VI secretion and phage assembly